MRTWRPVRAASRRVRARASELRSASVSCVAISTTRVSSAGVLTPVRSYVTARVRSRRRRSPPARRASAASADTSGPWTQQNGTARRRVAPQGRPSGIRYVQPRGPTRGPPADESRVESPGGLPAVSCAAGSVIDPHRCVPAEALPAPQGHFHVHGIEFHRESPHAAALGRDQAGARADERVVDRLAGLEMVTERRLEEEQGLLRRVVEGRLGRASARHLRARRAPDGGLIAGAAEGQPGALLADDPGGLVAPVVPG